MRIDLIDVDAVNNGKPKFGQYLISGIIREGSDCLA